MGATNDQVERARAGVEHRIIGSSIEFREILPDEDKDGKPLPVLQGYAARFNTRSLPLGIMGFREEIDPQAFDESLAKNPDVRFTFNHNPNKVYGRTKAGTLRCWRDDNGLRFEVALPRHHDAEGLAESIKRGDVTQCSFSFRTLDDDWSRDDEGTSFADCSKSILITATSPPSRFRLIRIPTLACARSTTRSASRELSD